MKLAAAFAPSQDVRDRFFSTTPTSLGWALAPVISDINDGVLADWSYAASILDPLRVGRDTEALVASYLEEERPDVLLLSSTYDSHNEAIKIARRARELTPDVLIIYGGPHVDEVASPRVMELLPQTFPLNEVASPFDVLVAGDGEMLLGALLREFGTLGSRRAFLAALIERVPAGIAAASGGWRLFTRDGGMVPLAIGTSPLLLEGLPSMPRHLFANDMDLYGFSCFYREGDDGTRTLLPSTSTLLHRGCRARCTFCSERGGYNERGVRDIEAELSILDSAGYRGLFFDDSTLSDQDIALVAPILRSHGMQYGSLNRFDKLVERRYVSDLVKAGFVYQYCAIEQLDDDVLKVSAKGQGVEDIRRAANLLRDAGVSLGVSLLFGLPRETRDTILATLDFVAELANDGFLSCVSTSMFSFHPNTPQTLNSAEGRALHDTIRFDQAPPNMGTPWSDFEEGQWWHRPAVTADWAAWIAEEAKARVGNYLVRSMDKLGVPVSNPATGV